MTRHTVTSATRFTWLLAVISEATNAASSAGDAAAATSVMVAANDARMGNMLKNGGI